MSSTVHLPGGGNRSRKIDHKKGINIYRYDDLTDLEENAPQRISAVVATGVEKEEEDVSARNVDKGRNTIFRRRLIHP
jgi:hypothetical protein